MFEERPSIIGRRTIEILLYDFDAYSRHVCIGGTQIQLGQLDLSNKVVLWNPLGSCSEQVTIFQIRLNSKRLNQKKTVVIFYLGRKN